METQPQFQNHNGNGKATATQAPEPELPTVKRPSIVPCLIIAALVFGIVQIIRWWHIL